MKRRLLAVVLSGLVIILAGCNNYQLLTTNQEDAVYHVESQALDPKVVGNYPQSASNIVTNSKPMKADIKVSLDNKRLKSVPLQGYDYDPEVAQYLQPSPKIESDSPVVRELAATIAPREKDILKIAQAALQWTSKTIKYDQGLGDRIFRGEIASQGAIDTIRSRSGTCSEFTNVFIAIMRNKGIPAKYVTGVIYDGAYHAWAEIYLQGVGWVPVEPQLGKLNITNRHIKLFEGTDFTSTVAAQIKLINLQADVKKLN